MRYYKKIEILNKVQYHNDTKPLYMYFAMVFKKYF